MSADPLRTWWDALEQGGYGPHGQPYDFRARCPRCDDTRDDELHVFIGADGRAVPHCFACIGHPKDIAQAAGIEPRDSLPAGHRHARRREFAPARRSDFDGNARTAANVLWALERLGERWKVAITVDRCPFCGWEHPDPVLFVVDSAGGPFVHCRGDCTADQFLQALAGKATELPNQGNLPDQWWIRTSVEAPE